MGWYVAALLAVASLVAVVIALRRRRPRQPIGLGLTPGTGGVGRIEELFRWAQSHHRLTQEQQRQLDAVLHTIKDHGIWHRTFRDRMKGFEERLERLEQAGGSNAGGKKE